MKKSKKLSRKVIKHPHLTPIPTSSVLLERSPQRLDYSGQTIFQFLQEMNKSPRFGRKVGKVGKVGKVVKNGVKSVKKVKKEEKSGKKVRKSVKKVRKSKVY